MAASLTPARRILDFHFGGSPTGRGSARATPACILALEDMDGLGSNGGLLIIAPSSHHGKGDGALLKRLSRLDHVFHIGLPGLEERAEGFTPAYLRAHAIMPYTLENRPYFVP